MNQAILWSAVGAIATVIIALFTGLMYLDNRNSAINSEKVLAILQEQSPKMKQSQLLSTYAKNSTVPEPHSKNELRTRIKSNTEGTPSIIMAACIMLAGQTYNVPPAVLFGVFKVRRGEIGKEYGPLPDGTFDIGPMKVNSAKIPDLAERWEVSEKAAKRWLLGDPCTNVGVAAWSLSRYMARTSSLSQAIEVYNEQSSQENEAFKEQVIEAMQKSGLIRENVQPSKKEDG